MPKLFPREVSPGVLDNDSITGGSIQSQKGTALRAAAHLHLQILVCLLNNESHQGLVTPHIPENTAIQDSIQTK